MDSLADVDAQVPRVNAHFRRWGMEVHEGTSTKDSKSEVLFVAAPEHMYDDPETFTDAHGSRDLGAGCFIRIRVHGGGVPPRGADTYVPISSQIAA